MDLDAIREEGRLAYLEGKYLNDCPYDWPLTGGAWQDGWYAAIASASGIERLTAERERLRAALKGCRELFSEIRKDWSDPRKVKNEIREGWAVIDAALTGEDT